MESALQEVNSSARKNETKVEILYKATGFGCYKVIKYRLISPTFYLKVIEL